MFKEMFKEMEGNIMALAALLVGIGSLVLAIIGGAAGTNIVLSLILLIISLIGGIVGIVLSANTMKKIPEKKGMGVGGLVTSILAIVYSVISLIACVACLAIGGAALNEVGKAAEESYNNMTPEQQAEVQQSIDNATKEIEKSLNEAQ